MLKFQKNRKFSLLKVLCLCSFRITHSPVSLNDNYYNYLFQTDYSSFLKIVQRSFFIFYAYFLKTIFTSIHLSLT